MKFPSSHLLITAVFLLVFLPGGAFATVRAERIIVVKSTRRLFLVKDGLVLRSFSVALGRQDGGKICRGDCKTPEGSYVIDRRNANSRFYKSLHISYPNAADRLKSRKTGSRPGGDVMIHGLPKGFEDLGTAQSERNWTKGCIAVSNAEMDEIWRLVRNGTPIDIIP